MIDDVDAFLLLLLLLGVVGAVCVVLRIGGVL